MTLNIDEMMLDIGWVRKNINEEPFLQDIKEKQVNTTMESYIEKFKIFADLDGNEIVNTSDWLKFAKYVGTIYGSLVSLMYVLLGQDFSKVLDNIYFLVIFAILAVFIACALVIVMKNKNGDKKEIKRLKTLNQEQAWTIYSLEVAQKESNHKNVLDMQEKDFQIKIKDTLYKIEKLKQYDPLVEEEDIISTD